MSKFQELIASPVPVLVDFYADWCQPCHMMAPILKEVKHHFGDRLRIVKIDVDKNQAVSGKYGIRSIPTLVLFQNGTERWRQAGVVPQEQLQQQLQTFL